MHELSIAMSILDIAAEEAQRHGGRAFAIHLKLGPLSGVVKEALLAAYELAREGSSLADTQLLIEEVPAVVYCSVCVADRPLKSIQHLRCSVCGAPTPQVVSGRELEIVAIELES